MNHQRQPSSTVHRSDSIEWEELPSLNAAHRHHIDSRRTESMRIPAPVWLDTVPSELGGSASVDQPFREVLEGLAVREVGGADLIRHLFGAGRGG